MRQMKCPSCGHLYDDKASDAARTKGEAMTERVSSEDIRGINRNNGRLLSEWEVDLAADLLDARAEIERLRALTSIAPDPIEAEYRDAAQAHGEADIEFELCSCDGPVDCPHWNATVRTRVRLIAARAARDGRK